MTTTSIEMRVELLEKQIAQLLSDKTIDVSDEKPKKKAKKDKKAESDDDKPKKKRTSGYILYSNSMRDEVKDALTYRWREAEEPGYHARTSKELEGSWRGRARSLEGEGKGDQGC